MRDEQGVFSAPDGLELFHQRWLPDAAPRAAVVLVHGFGEHSGRYANVVGYLVPRGHAVFGFDLRGHGRSAGPRGGLGAWDEYRQDLGAFLEQVAAAQPGLPLFLYGHSLGGTIALEFALRRPTGLRGVVASGPMLGPPGVAPFLLALSRVLSTALPRFTLEAGLDADVLSRDPAVAPAYRGDPLVHGKACARLGGESQRVTRWLQDHAGELSLPLLIVQGEDDRLCAPADSLRFFENAGSADKTRLMYPGGFHEPHNDIEHARVLADVEDWLSRRL
jgi:alpha-beta hydrolase superfamily lysophospholipase